MTNQRLTKNSNLMDIYLPLYKIEDERKTVKKTALKLIDLHHKIFYAILSKFCQI